MVLLGKSRLTMYCSQLKQFVASSDILRNNVQCVCAIDEITFGDIQDKKIIIINNKPKESEGQHWLAVYKDEENKCAEIFDSLGTNLEALKVFLSFPPQYTIAYNIAPLQSEKSIACAYFVLHFVYIRYFDADLDFHELLSTHYCTNVVTNERNVLEFLTFENIVQ